MDTYFPRTDLFGIWILTRSGFAFIALSRSLIAVRLTPKCSASRSNFHLSTQRNLASSVRSKYSRSQDWLYASVVTGPLGSCRFTRPPPIFFYLRFKHFQNVRFSD